MEPNRLSRPSVEKRFLSEDYWAVILGIFIVASAMILSAGAGNDLVGWINKPGEWVSSPASSFAGVKGSVTVVTGTAVAITVLGLVLVPHLFVKRQLFRGLIGYSGIALLAVVAMVMSGQEVIKYYNLEYVLWALLLGALIGNTIGLPAWLMAAPSGEFLIKLGLVLLGMEVLMGKLVVLGLPGILVAWVVTPIVLISTFWFGTRVLGIQSPSLVMTIAADMSVCGVSAAIATGAACRAKKEELTLAISLSLAFTAVMMVVMPVAIRFLGIDDIVGGAWLGGTIDSTGAVAAAGAALGDRALKIATTVKMIQNILIGVIAFAVSIYWAYRFDHGDEASQDKRSFFGEIWARFPKFVLGFLAVSILASVLDATSEAGAVLVKQAIDMVTKELRGWLFCMAFVRIGLDMRLETLAPALKGGKPMILYVVGQALNIALTGAMASLVFGWWFREAIEQWLPK